MIVHLRRHAGLAAGLAVASLAVAGPAGADPNPSQRVQSNVHPGTVSQELYYLSHKPAIPAPGKEFRAIDVHGAATPSPPSAVSEPVSASGFDWGDAAIGAGGALGLVLVLGGSAAATTRRHRPATA